MGKASVERKNAEAILKKIANGIADDWTAYMLGGERFPADGMAVMSLEKAADMGDLNAVRRAVADHIVMLQEATDRTFKSGRMSSNTVSLRTY